MIALESTCSCRSCGIKLLTQTISRVVIFAMTHQGPHRQYHTQNHSGMGMQLTSSSAGTPMAAVNVCLDFAMPGSIGDIHSHLSMPFDHDQAPAARGACLRGADSCHQCMEHGVLAVTLTVAMPVKNVPSRYKMVTREPALLASLLPHSIDYLLITTLLTDCTTYLSSVIQCYTNKDVHILLPIPANWLSPRERARQGSATSLCSSA